MGKTVFSVTQEEEEQESRILGVRMAKVYEIWNILLHTQIFAGTDNIGIIKKTNLRSKRHMAVTSPIPGSLQVPCRSS